MKQYTALVLTIFFSTIAFGVKKNEEPVSPIKTKRVIVCPQPRRYCSGTTIDLTELLPKEREDPQDIINRYGVLNYDNMMYHYKLFINSTNRKLKRNQ